MVMADIMYGGAGVAGGVGAGSGAIVGAGGGVGVGTTGTGGDVNEENYTEFYGTVNNTSARPRYPGLYVGNLTWWTTDQDVINAINSVGITDVQEVKFFENRNNGQSKGFCVVTFNSEASLPIVMEKLPKLELYGQSPVVTPYNRQNLNLFESQTKTRPQINSNNGPNSHAAGIMGISSISGVHANTQGLPYSNMNTYQQGAGGVGGFGGGPRAPYAPHMRPMMRAPRPQMMMQPQQLPNHIIAGGHRMNHRMRFMPQPQAWGMAQPVGMDMATNRVESKSDGSNDMAPTSRPRLDDSYSSSRSRGDDRDRSRRDDEISTRRDSDSRRDDGYSGSSRRGDDGRGSSRRELENSSLGTSSSSRRGGDEGSSSSGRRDERSSRREEKSFRREEKSLRHQSRPDDRGRSRSRDRSRERKERRERRSERY